MAFKFTSKWRFASGVILFLLATALVWVVLRANQVTEQYLITQANLPSGTLLSAVQLDTVAVQLGQAQGAYLKALPAGAVLTRPVSAGELIASSAVSFASEASQRLVVLTASSPIAASLKPGSRVDIWVAPKLEQAHGPAFILVSGAELAAIRKPEEMFASGSAILEIRVPTDSVGLVLDAIAADSEISVISSE